VTCGVAVQRAGSSGRCGPSRVQRAAVRDQPVLSAASLVPDEVLSGTYGREVEVAFDAMTEAIHVVCMATLSMEEKKDKTAIGLHGMDVERAFVRTCMDGSKTTLANASVTAAICRRLLEHFPDDAVLCEEDSELLGRDPEFAGTTASLLSDFKIVEGATPQDAVRWTGHAGTYMAQVEAGKLPSRYWALTPVDTTDEFLQTKQYCMTLALVVDGKPVVGLMGCPVLAFDHPSRTVQHPSGVPFFFAVKGQGAWTQLVITERENGVYQGKYRLKGKPLPLKVGEKIKRGNDGLYDMLGTDQLKIAMGSRLREDIFADAERIGKILGSEYPKFDMTKSSIKYCWLARGETDVVWYLTTGLYDRSAVEHLAHHAAGALIVAESGAVVADLDGKPIEWSGPVLEANRGLVATDPGKVPLMGLVKAVEQATSTSEQAYEKRCEKRKEVSKLLKYIFEKMPEFAETDEEREGAEKVRAKGLEMLQDANQMDEIAQDSMNRDKPILGEREVQDDAFSDGGGDIPMSPISTG